MPNRSRLAWLLLVLAATLITYANGLDGAFTYDDKAIVRDNLRIRSPRRLSQVFGSHYFGGPRGTGSIYRPLLLVSFALQWWIHGQQVILFHVVNLLLHVAATGLLLLLLLRLGLPPPTCGAAAILFALHPIHVEAVTSIVGRGETLSAVLVLGFLLLALRFARRERGSWLALAGALMLYPAAVLTKESASIAPAVACLLLLFVFGGSWRERVGTTLARGWPLFLGCVAGLAGVFALRHAIFGGFLKSPATGFFEVENPLATLPALPRAVNACLIFFRYLGRTVFPLHLSADESAWSIRVLPLRAPLGLFAAALLASLAIAAVARLPRRLPAALGFLWMGLFLLPAGNLLFPLGTIFAERLAYLPSAGVCLAMADAVTRGARVWSEVGRRRALALAAVALLFAARTVVRNPVWWTDQTLFANSLATSPRSAKAHYNYAFIRAHHQDWSEALAHYTEAVRIYDGYWDAWAGKGRMEKELGRLDLAEASYRKSLAILPDYENGYFGLGLVEEERGNFAAAREAYARGMTENPASLPLAFRLALMDSRLRRPDAEKDWRLAVKLDPGSALVRAEHASWLFGRGRVAEARVEAREALRRNPGCVAALRLLADSDARDGLALGEGLAREKIFRITGSDEDRRSLEEFASRHESKGARSRRIRELLRPSGR